MSELDALNDEIAKRTGGKLLGEMTTEELRTAFTAGPIMFRDGKVITG